jgi:hypothetical protein
MPNPALGLSSRKCVWRRPSPSASGNLETLALPGFGAGSIGFSWIAGFGFPWISLDSLVRIGSFQWVTGVPRREVFSSSSPRKLNSITLLK